VADNEFCFVLEIVLNDDTDFTGALLVNPDSEKLVDRF
jgi:hypothetical protein